MAPGDVAKEIGQSDRCQYTYDDQYNDDLYQGKTASIIKIFHVPILNDNLYIERTMLPSSIPCSICNKNKYVDFYK